VRTRAIATLVALLFAEPFPARAQTPDISSDREVVLQQLTDSQVVRLSTSELGRRQGFLLEHDTAALVLTAGRQPLRIPAVTIDTVWTRGSSTGVGALVGAIIGAGLGALAGTELGEENAGSADNVLGMAGIGAIGGGLVGAIIGTPITRWKRRFP
jgi:hypothetical protein